MKKKFLLSITAMLLMCVTAFAQSESTLKGDVNEDGKVDVADINAIIKIMKDAGGTSGETVYYWYTGTTLPDSTNINSIATETLTAKPTTWTAANPKSIAATNNTGNSSYLYYCFPTDWNVTVLDLDKVSEVSLADVSTFTYNNIEYTVKRTGRIIPNGITKSYYAKC